MQPGTRISFGINKVLSYLAGLTPTGSVSVLVCFLGGLRAGRPFLEQFIVNIQASGATVNQLGCMSQAESD